MSWDTYLENLPYPRRRELCDILDECDWKSLAFDCGFNQTRIRKLERAFGSAYGDRSPSNEVLQEYEHCNPTLLDLYNKLKRWNLIQCAEILIAYVGFEPESAHQRPFVNQNPNQQYNSDSFISRQEEEKRSYRALPIPVSEPRKVKRTPVQNKYDVDQAGPLSPIGPPCSHYQEITDRQLPEGSLSESRRTFPAALRAGSENFANPGDRNLHGGVLLNTYPLELKISEDMSLNQLPAHHFQYQELKKATYGFDEDYAIGKGIFGQAYKAKLDIKKTASFVIKRLSTHSVDNKQPMTHMQSEIEMFQKFCHPNLIPMTGYSVDGPELCFVFEYMSYGSLADNLYSRGDIHLTVMQRCIILLGAAVAIEYLHKEFDKPFVHGDIKSENILLDNHLEAKLTDFGQESITGCYDYDPKVLLSRREICKAYLPPEFDCKMTVKGDVFSFGIVICECCTAEKPFDQKREGGALLRTYINNRSELDGFSLSSSFNESILNVHNCLCDRNVLEVWPAKLWHKLFMIGRDSIRDKKIERPVMTDVVRSIKGIVEELQHHHAFSESGESCLMYRNDLNVEDNNIHEELHRMSLHLTTSDRGIDNESTMVVESQSNQEVCDAIDDVPIKSFPSFIGSCGSSGSEESRADDDMGNSEDTSSAEVDLLLNLQVGEWGQLCESREILEGQRNIDNTEEDNITGKAWPSFLNMRNSGCSLDNCMESLQSIAHRAASLDTEVVRNCDRYSLYSKNAFSNSSDLNETKFNSDPGPNIYADNSFMNVRIDKSTLSGPRAVSSSIGSAPIYRSANIP